MDYISPFPASRGNAILGLAQIGLALMPSYTYICAYGHQHIRIGVPVDERAGFKVCPADGLPVNLAVTMPALRFYLSPSEWYRKPKDWDTADRKELLRHEGREHLI